MQGSIPIDFSRWRRRPYRQGFFQAILAPAGAKIAWKKPCRFKGNSHMISPDRTRLISILLSNSRLPGHLSPDLWHSMLIILILLIHATTRQQWNASWQSKRRRSAQILSTAIVTVALATRTGMKRVGTRPDGRRCHVPVWKRWNTASYIFGSRMLI